MSVYYQNLESLLKNNPNLEIEDFLYQKKGYIIEPDDIPISHVVSNIKEFLTPIYKEIYNPGIIINF